MTFIIITSIVAFTITILVLVGLLLVAHANLVQQGNVKIIINGKKEEAIVVAAGSSLLSALGIKKIFLPSACGGGGTCAMCRCKILDGGGDILPTEQGHLSRSEQKDHMRLACQVKVKNDLNIEIPEEIFGIKKWKCEVVSNYNVSTFIKEIVVKLPENEHLEFESGGYIQIDVPPIDVDFKKMDITPHPDLKHDSKVYQSDWDKFKMWNLKMTNKEPLFRAYSMANHPAEGNKIMLNIRINTPPWDKTTNNWKNVNSGVCSSYIFSQKQGDLVDISGPYGEFFIQPTQREMVYVGGGAGMAPLRSHIFHLFHTEKTKRKVSYWYGGRSKRELFYTEQFRKIEKDFPNFKFYIGLSEPLQEDNWKIKKSLHDETGDGYVGFIHKVLYDNYLSQHNEVEDIEYYLCGPPMMNSAVLKMLDDLGVPKENIRFDDFGN